MPTPWSSVEHHRRFLSHGADRVLNEYILWLRRNNVRETTIATRAYIAAKLMHELKIKSANEINAEKINQYIYRLISNGVKDLASIIKNLRSFIKYLKEKSIIEHMNHEKYDKILETILKTPNTKPKPVETITEKEVDKLVNEASKLKYKTLIAVLYETGARINEILNVKIKDIIEDEYGFKIIIKTAKTTPGAARVIKYSGLLARWLQEHPEKENPEAYLFPVSYKTFYNYITRLSRRVLKRKVHPHMLRHSRATHLLKYLSPSTVMKIMRWNDIRMVKRYEHIIPKDAEEQLLRKIYRIEPEETPRAQNIRCPRCLRQIPSDSKFCPYCGLPLDVEEQVRIMDEETELMSKLMKIINKIKRDKTLRKQILELI